MEQHKLKESEEIVFYELREKKEDEFVLEEMSEEDFSIDILLSQKFKEMVEKKKFCSEKWLHYFAKYTDKSWMEQNKGKKTGVHHGLRVMVWKYTEKMYLDGKYLAGEKVVQLDLKVLREHINRNTMYKSAQEVPPSLLRRFETKFAVFEGDCLEATFLLQDEGMNPICLNMANQSQPGLLIWKNMVFFFGSFLAGKKKVEDTSRVMEHRRRTCTGEATTLSPWTTPRSCKRGTGDIPSPLEGPSTRPMC